MPEPYDGGMITVLSPGARTLVQDAGRPGREHLGVPASGAADGLSLRLANLIVGNSAAEAAFEVAAHGPTFQFTSDATIAYAGADTDLFLDDRPVPCRHTLRVRAGQMLSIGALRGGLYGYLAVGGGLDVPRVLGSAASCTLSGLGTPALTSGQSVGLAHADQHVEDAFAAPTSAPLPVTSTLRVLPGPHVDLFGKDAIDAFFAARWSVSALSSRVGVRLDGSSPVTVPQVSLPSMGMVRGAIQVPPNGLPIVLGPDHGTVGGYPVLGVVHPDDMPALMQRVAGATLAFAPAGTRTSTDAPTSAPVLFHRHMAAASA
jgi:biotin-dependent carboxylase-like uncharacterized protein